MKSSTHRINNLKLKFYTWGNPNKPKLFLFHGWLDTAASFDFLCPYLAKHYYCIAPDMRGYGKSEHTPNVLGYFFYEYVADLKAIFDKFSPNTKVRILGHSLGGAISSVFAGTYPERVSHLINVEGYAFRDNPADRGPEKLRHWLDSLDDQGFPVFKDNKDFAQRLMKQNPRLPHDRALYLAKHLTKKVRLGVQMAADPRHKLAEPYLFSRALLYKFWEAIQAKSVWIHAANTEMNTWVKSDHFDAEIQERLSHFPRGTQFKVIPECGHMVHHEKPYELANLVLAFLK